ncbi:MULTISPECIES: elongation factor G [Pseudovibrio]|uniref:elongation factor G n=1 Tax=Stappiaceae TaxID=2821832 RepID=UPI0023650172|nr:MULTISPECIES: elongation factor G [Pseudovibrio]MDD7910240.1 elongation factor G [Pseudovibrio exalbescens]MDX5593953.1 elongation factor G [Pseudovibrio sp. SPO723]
MGEKGVGGAGGRVSSPRCVAIVGPFASGKTTLFEALLARTGAIARQGSVTAGTTLGDSSEEARSHGMSVEANIADCTYKGDRYTFIDCPGSVEFLSESEAILGGVDLAIVVAEPDEKKIPALQVILKSLEAKSIPHVLFLNKIDKATGRVRETLAALQPASSVPLLLRQIPIWTDGAVSGYIDLALERAFVYHDDGPSTVVDLADEEKARELEARYSMMEMLADHDDELMEKLLEEDEPDNEMVFKDLTETMQHGDVVPVFIGCAEKNNGIRRLLKELRHEAPTVEQTRERVGLSENDAGTVQVLKTYHTQHGGKLSVCRVLSGTVSESSLLRDANNNELRPSGLFRMKGSQPVKNDGPVVAGDLIAFGKLEDVKTGDTLGIGKAPETLLDAARPLEPVLTTGLKAAERKDEVRLSSALAKLLEEDPSLRLVQSQESGQTILEGQGEMHLRVAVEKLRGKYGLNVEQYEPTIPYQETIRGKTELRRRHKKQSGGHGQFGDVALTIQPMPRGEGHAFSDTISGGVVPKQYIPSVKHGVEEALQKGPLGFPVVDVGVVLTDGSYHSVDSSDQAFRMAAILAMRDGLKECKPVLLEPISKVVVACPSDATARITAIVSGRRGQILGFDARPGWDGWDEVQALMPDSEVGDLIVELRSATAGVASFRREFDHMEELSGKPAEQVVMKYGSEAVA